jgi:hypothetical protein
MAATKYDLRIEQGKTTRRIIRWETTPLIYKAISSISNTAPVSITASNHLVPSGWRVAVTGVKGMEEINCKGNPPRQGDYHRATYVGPNEITINDISAADYDTYTSGGYLVYYTPMPLVGYSARMKIKDKVGGTVLEELTSDAGEIAIDTNNYTITVTVSAAQSEAYTWMRGVYDLEMFIGSPEEVTAILTGAVLVTKEVTTGA